MKVCVKKELKAYDAIIVPVYEGKLKFKELTIPFNQLKKEGKFEGKLKTVYRLNVYDKKVLKEVILVGLGKKKATFRDTLFAFGMGVKEAIKAKANNISIYLKDLDNEEFLLKAASESCLLSSYKFEMKKEIKNEKYNFNLITKFTSSKIKESLVIAEANLVCRDLVNKPANVIYPKTLADEVKKLGKEKGFDVKVYGLKDIQKLKMEAFLSVARASDKEPQLIVMNYMGNPKDKEILGLVGKGLTYDSGGLSIKPTSGMVTMKCDMGGAATVISAISAVAEMKLKKNVIAVVASCENMISGDAYRPGDIIGSMGGKTIYIGNTDAEGRLTLIDAMYYIVNNMKVTKVVDVATLTGAAIHAGGEVSVVSISNNDSFYNKIEKAHENSGELITRLPIFDEYVELVKHKEADLTNTAGSPGSVTAGLFVGAYIDKTPWIHLDIAPTAFVSKPTSIFNEGATGLTVKPLYYLAKEL